MCEDIITMTRQELERYQVIGRSLKKEITEAKAGELLELSERHIRRLVKRVRLKGLRGLVQGELGPGMNPCPAASYGRCMIAGG